jgi:membrane protease YdiL (CAAX protease family)
MQEQGDIMEREVPVLDDRKLIKKNVNLFTGGLLLYLMIGFIAFLFYVIGYLAIGVIINGKTMDTLMTSLDKDVMETGIPYLINICIGLPILFLLCKGVVRRKLTVVNKAMCRSDFFILLSCFMSVQLVYLLVSMGAEVLFNQFGYTLHNAIESAGSESRTISMFLYASVFGPIVEEIIFRGLVMRGLERYGKQLAIIVSSIIFGVYHGNLVQGVFAFFVGIVLGYVAMEYSIKWAIVLHVINNCLFNDLLSYAVSGFNDSTQTIIVMSMIGFFGLCTLIVFLIKRKEIAAFFKVNKAFGLKHALTSLGMVFYFVIMFLISLTGIEKL